MRVVIGNIEVYSKRYESFEDLSDEYVDHETKRGRRVPDYDFDAWTVAMAVLLLDKAVDVFQDYLARRRQEQDSRNRDQLEADRHEELLKELSRIRETDRGDEGSRRSSADGAQGEEMVPVVRALRLIQENGFTIEITVETEAEADLKEALKSLTEQNVEGGDWL